MLPAAGLLALGMIACSLALTAVLVRREMVALTSAIGAVSALHDALGALSVEAARTGLVRQESRATSPTPPDR